MKKKKIELRKLGLNKEVVASLGTEQAKHVLGGAHTDVVQPSICVLCYPETQNKTLCVNPSVCVLCYPNTHPTQFPC